MPASLTTPQQRRQHPSRRLCAGLCVWVMLLAGCAAPVGPSEPPAAPVAFGTASPSPSLPLVPASATAPELKTSAVALPGTLTSDVASRPSTVAIEPVATDPLRPGVRLDLDDRSARTDLWDRVRRGFGMPDLDTELVRDRERWYASRPDYVQRMTERGGRYLFHIIEEVERRGMPSELALLPFIESAFNPQAMSSAKASGMWQFVPATGRDFDLKQNVFRDDRRDVLASTRAALDYLQKLHRMFGDWHLALAAYNWGEGSVGRAIARNQKMGLPTDYLSLKMPAETQLYVPKLQAVKNLIASPQSFGLTLPELTNHPFFLSVTIERDIDVDLAVQLAGMKLEDFKSLNPQMNKPVIFAAGTPQVLLPYDNANQFLHGLGKHRGGLATWTAWVAPSNLSTADAARRIGMDEGLLREINRIPPRMLVKAGSTLLVPRSDRRLADVSEQVADNAMMSLAPLPAPLRRVTLKAGRKDSVASIAARYRTEPSQVAQWNGTATSAQFKQGQRIVVYLAKPAAGVRTVRTARTKATGQHTLLQARTKGGLKLAKN